MPIIETPDRPLMLSEAMHLAAAIAELASTVNLLANATLPEAQKERVSLRLQGVKSMLDAFLQDTARRSIHG